MGDIHVHGKECKVEKRESLASQGDVYLEDDIPPSVDANTTPATWAPNPQKLEDVPWTVWVLMLAINLSCLIQAIGDLVIEFLALSGAVNFPYRPDFLSLTLLSALIAFQALWGMRRHELDVTANSLRVSIVLESMLIWGDVYFVFLEENEDFLNFRVAFLCMTSINVLCLVIIVGKLQISLVENLLPRKNDDPPPRSRTSISSS